MQMTVIKYHTVHSIFLLYNDSVCSERVLVQTRFKTHLFLVFVVLVGWERVNSKLIAPALIRRASKRPRPANSTDWPSTKYEVGESVPQHMWPRGCGSLGPPTCSLFSKRTAFCRRRSELSADSIYVIKQLFRVANCKPSVNNTAPNLPLQSLAFPASVRYFWFERRSILNFLL